MCLKCIEKKRKEHAEAVEQAMEHLDAQGCPEDSIVRGLVDVNLACNADPMLEELIKEMYPMHQMFVQ